VFYLILNYAQADFTLCQLNKWNMLTIITRNIIMFNRKSTWQTIINLLGNITFQMCCLICFQIFSIIFWIFGLRGWRWCYSIETRPFSSTYVIVLWISVLLVVVYNMIHYYIYTHTHTRLWLCVKERRGDYLTQYFRHTLEECVIYNIAENQSKEWFCHSILVSENVLQVWVCCIS
jgi:hypothetical protein